MMGDDKRKYERDFVISFVYFVLCCYRRLVCDLFDSFDLDDQGKMVDTKCEIEFGVYSRSCSCALYVRLI